MDRCECDFPAFEMINYLTPVFTTTLLAKDVAWEPVEQRDFVQTIR